jgi:hypothetical protein
VKQSRRTGRGLVGAAIATLLLSTGVLFLGVRASADNGEPSAPPPAPSVELDRLFELPDSFSSHTERLGGAIRPEWLLLFREARAAVTEAEDNLRQAEQELDQLANDSSSWNVSPPGAGEPNSGPLSFRLRQDIRRFREDEERARKALRALEVRADLAGVPAGWRDSQSD